MALFVKGLPIFLVRRVTGKFHQSIESSVLVVF